MHNIIVLGGGFGGLQAALRLGKSIKKLKLADRYRVTLVNREPYHTFTPLLYEIATTAGSTAEKLQSLVTFNLRELLAGLPVEVMEDTVVSVDSAGRRIKLKKSEIGFDYLLLAPGSETGFFGIPGLAEYSLPLKTFTDALKVRAALASTVEKIAKTVPVRVVVGGGGANGVEIAAEIFNNYYGKHLHVTIVEAGPEILGGFGAQATAKARRRLKHFGVSVLTHERIAKVFPSFIVLESGEKIDCQLLFWTGGVQPSPIAELLPFKEDARGRIAVTSNLAAGENVFAIGDIAYFTNPKTNEPIPSVARPAIMEGRIAAASIMEKIKTAEGITPAAKTISFRPRNYPYIVSVGGKYAIAKLGPFVFGGFIAWIFKGIVELNYFVSIMPWWKALAVWCKGLFIFIRNKRLG